MSTTPETAPTDGLAAGDRSRSRLTIGRLLLAIAAIAPPIAYLSALSRYQGRGNLQTILRSVVCLVLTGLVVAAARKATALQAMTQVALTVLACWAMTDSDDARTSLDLVPIVVGVFGVVPLWLTNLAGDSRGPIASRARWAGRVGLSVGLHFAAILLYLLATQVLLASHWGIGLGPGLPAIEGRMTTGVSRMFWTPTWVRSPGVVMSGQTAPTPNPPFVGPAMNRPSTPDPPTGPDARAPVGDR